MLNSRLGRPAQDPLCGDGFGFPAIVGIAWTTTNNALTAVGQLLFPTSLSTDRKRHVARVATIDLQVRDMVGVAPVAGVPYALLVVDGVSGATIATLSTGTIAGGTFGTTLDLRDAVTGQGYALDAGQALQLKVNTTTVQLTGFAHVTFETYGLEA